MVYTNLHRRAARRHNLQKFLVGSFKLDAPLQDVIVLIGLLLAFAQLLLQTVVHVCHSLKSLFQLLVLALDLSL